jgi:WD40 repeat protein/uncharacterized protein YjbI with pentapeptide repeats
MHIYTKNQQEFNDAFVFRVKTLLNELFQSLGQEEDWLAALDKKLSQGALLAGTAAAGLTIAAAAAPATGGGSLVAAGGVVAIVGACVVSAQVISSGYRILTRTEEHRGKLMTENEMMKEEQQLLWNLALEEVADIATLKYRHAIEKKIHPDSITAFAYYGAERVVKKLKDDLRTYFKQHPSLRVSPHTKQNLVTMIQLNPQELIRYLQQSQNVAWWGTSEKITINDAIQAYWSGSQDVPTKWAYGRSRVAFCQHSASEINYVHYASASESIHFSESTLPYVGYETEVAPSALLTPELMFNGRALVVLKDSDAIHTEVRAYLAEYRSVTPEDIKAYLAAIAKTSSHPKLALNDFLSQQLNMQVIAHCRGDVLKHEDLQGGNYTGVDFRYSVFEGDLRNTLWDHARLTGASFHTTPLNNASFRHASLQRSRWTNVTLRVDLTDADMRHAALMNCILSEVIDIRCHWDGMTMDDAVHMAEGNDKWLVEAEARWTNEHNNRLQCEHNAHEEFKKWQETQEAKWAAQDQINTMATTRLDALDAWKESIEQKPLREILDIIGTQGNAFFNATMLEPHIPLQVVAVGLVDKRPLPLSTALMTSPVVSNVQVTLLSSPMGAGKSTGVKRSVLEGLAVGELALLISAKHVITKGEPNAIHAFLRSKLTNEQINVMKKNLRMKLIVDGLEEGDFDFDRHYLLGDWAEFTKECVNGPWQLVITVSDDYLLKASNYRERLKRSEHVVYPYAHYAILPLNDAQISAFIQTYYPGKVNLNDPRCSGLSSLAKNPLWLRIICEVMARTDVLNAGEVYPTSRVALCNRFLQHWSVHALKKMERIDVDLKPKSIVLYLQDMAYLMFSEGTNQVVQRLDEEVRDILEVERDGFLQKKNPLTFKYLFECLHWRKAGSISPVTVRREGQSIIYRIEPIFRFYALATKLVGIIEDSLPNDDLMKRLVGWNYGYLTDPLTESVFDMLVELVNTHAQKEALVRALCDMVIRSNGSEGAIYSKAASNAMTLLSQLGINLSEHLSGVECQDLNVPNANLRHARLSNLKLTRMNVVGGYLQGAELAGTTMSHAKLKGAHFVDAARLFFPEQDPEVLAVYPTDKPIVAYSAMKTSDTVARGISMVGVDGSKYAGFFGHQKEVRCMEWVRYKSSSGAFEALLASASTRGTIKVWNGKANKVMKCREKMPINGLSWYQQGRLLASGGDDQGVRIWDVEKEACVFLYEMKGKVRAVLWGKVSPVLISAGEEGVLHRWELAIENQALIKPPALTLEWSPSTQKPAIYSVALSVDETHVAAGCADGVIYFYPLHQVPSLTAAVNAVPAVATRLQGHHGAVNALIWSARCLVSGGDDATIRVWDPHTGSSTAVLQGDGSPVKQLAWLWGERQVIAGQHRMFAVFDLDQQVDYLRTNKGTTYPVSCMAPLGRRVAIGHVDGQVWLWNIQTKTAQQVLTHAGAVLAMAWSQDRRYLATLGADQVVHVLEKNPQTGAIIPHEAPWGSIQPMEGVKFNHLTWVLDPISKRVQLAIAATDGTIHRWHLEDTMHRWVACASLVCEENAVAMDCLAAASQSGVSLFLAVANDSRLFIWDMTQLELGPRVLSLHKKKVTGLSWSPDGLYLASQDDDHGVFVWDTHTWALVWSDQSSVEKKQVIWAMTTNKQQWLMLGTPDMIQLFHASKGPSLFRLYKKISPGVELMMGDEAHVFLLNKKSMDMMSLDEWIKEEDSARPFLTRLGHGTCVRGLDLTKLAADDLGADVKMYLKKEGARVAEDPPKSLYERSSDALLSLWGWDRYQQKLPKAPPPVETQQPVTPSFPLARLVLQRTSSTLRRLDTDEASSQDSPSPFRQGHT